MKNPSSMKVGIEPERRDEPFRSVLGCGAEDASGLSPPHDLFLPKEIVQAEWRTTCVPNFRSGAPKSEAQELGLRYEWKAKGILEQTFGVGFFPGPWFVYWDSPARAAKLCQPDGIWTTPKGVFLFEIKYRWCVEAWWKAKYLYLPVVEKALGVPVLGLCVVTRGVDPAIPVPERPKILESLDHYKEWPPLGGHARAQGDPLPPVDVFIWKGHER